MSSAHATPAIDVANTTKKPSPVDLTTHPSCRAAASRAARSCTRLNAIATSSPRSLLNAVEPSMSVNSTALGRAFITNPDPKGLCAPSSPMRLPHQLTLPGRLLMPLAVLMDKLTPVLTAEAIETMLREHPEVLEQLRERHSLLALAKELAGVEDYELQYLEAIPVSLREGIRAAVAEA